MNSKVISGELEKETHQRSNEYKCESPFFSIIMVSLNAEKYVSKSVDSILNQDFSNYEVIIKDGGSTDRTLELLPSDERIRVISAKDEGIYDAMNQAIQLAKGKYLYFLNFGDRLFDNGVLFRVYSRLSVQDHTRIFLYGNVYRDGIHYSLPQKITSFYLFRTSINHQATFWGRELLDTIGNYNLKYKVAADYDLECRAYFDTAIEYQHINTTICEYLSGGYSDSQAGRAILKKDFTCIHKEYFHPRTIIWFSFLQFISLKWLRRIIDSEKSPHWLRNFYRHFVNVVIGR